MRPFNTKAITLFASVLILSLVISSPLVSAGWLSELFSKLAPKAESKVVTKAESKVISKAENKLAVGEEGRLLSKEEQVQVNRINGVEFENAVLKTICKKGKCINDDAVLKSLYRIPKNSEFFVTDGIKARNLLKTMDVTTESGLTEFNRIPDAIKVTTDNRGYTKKVVIYDAKTSKSAIDAGSYRGQTYDYQKYCDSITKNHGTGICSIQYILPKEEARLILNQNPESVVPCLAMGAVTTIGWADAFCFVDIGYVYN